MTSASTSNSTSSSGKEEKAPQMLYRHLGKSGLKVSLLSFGAWTTFGLSVSEDTAYDCMEAAWKTGVNFFDNAEVYGAGKAESVMGNCLKKLMKNHNVQRSELVISTKLFWGPIKSVNTRGLSRKHIIEGTQESLKRLQLDYVDLLFAHRPDPETPIEEIVRAFNWVIEKGYAFYWGTSEWPASLIIEAQETAEKLKLIGPTMEQPRYNMLSRTRFEVEYDHVWNKYGYGSTIWSPLASGLLTGKYKSLDFPKDSRLAQTGLKWHLDQLESGEGYDLKEAKNLEGFFKAVEKIEPIAKKLNCTLAQLALAWCMANPHVSTVIMGASKPAQIYENAKALDIFPKLTKELLEDIEKALGNKPKPPVNWRA
eukprot:TRINITY_DN230_c0_g1_i1.p1 TRINITY_DN230_c0_g1~~TRINITY_DN230_c0_g1_i1.p1  ORF type:complete len:368 (-),score=83.36 TRINITY_DN230_c0_g1_i1:287-1390(-)